MRAELMQLFIASHQAAPCQQQQKPHPEVGEDMMGQGPLGKEMSAGGRLEGK